MVGVVTLLGRNLVPLAKLNISRNHVRRHRSPSFGVSKLYDHGDKETDTHWASRGGETQCAINRTCMKADWGNRSP